MDPEWATFVAAWMQARGVVTTAAIADLYARLQASETYGLAHSLWTVGASDREIRRLLDQAIDE